MLNDTIVLQPNHNYALQPIESIHFSSDAFFHLSDSNLTILNSKNNPLLAIQSHEIQIYGNQTVSNDLIVSRNIGIVQTNPLWNLDILGNVRIQNPDLTHFSTDLQLSSPISDDSYTLNVQKGNLEIYNQIALCYKNEIGPAIQWCNPHHSIQDAYLSISTSLQHSNIASFHKDGFHAVQSHLQNVYVEQFTLHNTSNVSNTVEMILSKAIGNPAYCLTTQKGSTLNQPGEITNKIGLSYQNTDGTFVPNSMIRFHRGSSNTGGWISMSVSNDMCRMILNPDGYLGIGGNHLTAQTPKTVVSISPTTFEPKITMLDGSANPYVDHYGMGVSYGQLNYHVENDMASHVFYAGGKNGDGKELLRISGNGSIYLSGNLNISSIPNQTLFHSDTPLGQPGDIVHDEEYLYIKTKQNRWKRIALSEF